MRRAFLWALLPTLVLFLSAPSVGDAQVTTSITSTTGTGNLGTTVTHAGNFYNITDGTRPGNGPNLFHSFGNFSVGAGDIGNFLNNTGLPTSNILGRVTGGNISNIYGTIQTTDFGTANLFLVNPSGIVFGPHGSVNVGGSVSFTTAQYLRMFDGVNSANFYANPANDSLANSVLAVAPVVDFGFLSPAAYGFLTPPGPNATITVQGSALSVPSGQSISLVGGKVVIEGGAQLSAPSGRIHLATTASPGEFAALPGESLANATSLQSVPNNPVDPASATSFTSYGLMSLAPGSSIDVSGASTVFVKGGQLVLSVNDAMLSTAESPGLPDTILLSPGSSIVTSSSGADPGADVQITVGTLQMDGAVVATINSGDGNGGSVSINSTTAGLTNGAGIFSSNELDFTTFAPAGSGNGGNLTADVGTLALTNGAGIISVNSSFGLGQGGNVTIAAKSLNLEEASTIASSTLGTGRGGDIVVSVQQASLSGGTTIASSTLGTGRGGDIVLSVRDASFSGGATIANQTFSSDLDAGAAGTVTVQGLQGAGSKADSLTLAGQGSGIISDSFGPARPGGIEVRAKTVSLTDNAVIQAGTPSDTGTTGNVTIDADSVDISGGGRIASQTFAADAGQVTITANALTLDNGSIETNTSGIGRGGDVVLKVGSVSLANGAMISSNTSDTGQAGDITMNVGTLSLSSASQISSASTGTNIFPNLDGTINPPGRAGNVTITATGSFRSDASTIATAAEANHGGDISITAQNVQLSNGTLITASSNAPLEVTELVLDQNVQLVPQVVGDGNAGNITIHSGSTFVMSNSLVTTEASQASGGQITITAPEMVRLINSRISTSVFGSPVDTAGGNITIDPQFVILQNSQILAQAFAGAGGAVEITAGVFLADPNSVVDVSSSLGIQSPVQIVGGRLTPLPQQFSSAAALLLANRCAADPTGQFSSFIQTGRDGVPQVPGALSPSPLSFLETLTSSSLGSSGPNWAAVRLGLDSVSFDDSTRFHSVCRS